MTERAARTEYDLGMHLDQTLRELSAQGGEAISGDDYDQARHDANPHWMHYNWFAGDGVLYWQGNGNGGNLSQFFRRRLSANELASLPANFLIKEAMPRHSCQSSPNTVATISAAEQERLHQIVTAAWDEAQRMPLSELAAHVGSRR